MREFIDNPCHVVGPKNRDKIEVADVVVSTNHVFFPANKFTRLISLPTSTIFVSGTSDITTILKYRSVMPMWKTLKELHNNNNNNNYTSK